MDQTKSNFRLRATAVFRRQAREIDSQIDSMLGRRSAKGNLRSGSTLGEMMQTIEEQTRQALDQILSEAAQLIEHRGRKWRAAMAGIREGLEEHVAGFARLTQKALRLADRRGSPSVQRAVDNELAAIARRLTDHLAEFRDGWTAPAPKLWKDRHPVVYAIALLILGTALGLVMPAAARVVLG